MTCPKNTYKFNVKKKYPFGCPPFDYYIGTMFSAVTITVLAADTFDNILTFGWIWICIRQTKMMM